MTAQIGEILLIDSQQYLIAEHPLHQYIKGLNSPPYFTPPSPTCWRGYYGKWELNNEQKTLTLKSEKNNSKKYLYSFEEQKLILSDIDAKDKTIYEKR